MRTQVSLVKSEEHYRGVQKSLFQIEESIQKVVSSISSLVIKVNLVVSTSKGYPKGVELAVTPIRAVESFIDFISPFYDGEIFIAERSAWGKTKEGFKLHGFSKLAEKYSKVSLIDLKDDKIIEKEIKYPEGKIDLPFSKTMIETPFLVSITRPKTHCSVVMTAGIKNVLVGGINGSWQCRLQIHKGKFVHNILTSIADFLYPNLSIIDGTIGMEGNGPIMGRKIESRWIISSFDPLAADSLCAYLMGIDLKDVGYLSLLKEKKVGACYPYEELEILGELPQKCVVPYKPHHSFNKQKKWR